VGGQSTLAVGGRAGKLVLPVICEQLLLNTDGVHSLRGFPPVLKDEWEKNFIGRTMSNPFGLSRRLLYSFVLIAPLEF